METQGGTPHVVTQKAVLPPKLARRGRKPIMPRILNVREACAILRLNERKVRDMLRDGRLQGFRATGSYQSAWRTTDLAILAFIGYPTNGYPTPAPRRRSDGQRTNFDKNNFFDLVRKHAAPEAAAKIIHEARAKGAAKSHAARRRNTMGRTLVLGPIQPPGDSGGVGA